MVSSLALRLVQNLSLCGPLEGATHIGTCGEPGEGAYVRIWLTAKDGRIENAAYATHGCPSSQASGAMTVTLCKGRTFEEASRITGTDVVTVLGGLPEGKGHFADMAVEALRKAMEQIG